MLVVVNPGEECLGITNARVTLTRALMSFLESMESLCTYDLLEENEW